MNHWSQPATHEDPDFTKEFNKLFDTLDVPEADETFDFYSYDQYLNMEFIVDNGEDHLKFVRFIKMTHGQEWYAYRYCQWSRALFKI